MSILPLSGAAKGCWIDALTVLALLAFIIAVLCSLAGCATPSRPDDGRNRDLIESMP